MRKKSIVFAGRNGKELLRDPLSYLFCLVLPLLMLVTMTFLNASIPPEAKMTIFRIDRLSSGIAVFSFSFVMLFAALQVSKDHSGSFLIRLYASPMTAADYIIGYTLPLLGIALGQAILTFAASAGIGLVTGVSFSFTNILLSLVTLFPSAVLFLGLGILFGSLLGEKTAPPVSSMVITLSSLIGGIWMDVDQMGGLLKKISQCFPFYHAVAASRAAVTGSWEDIGPSLLLVSVFAAVTYAAAILVFRRKMRQDIS